MKDLILVINPGSTSTKVAVYDDKELLAEETISHAKEELIKRISFQEQVAYRKTFILQFLQIFPEAIGRLRAVVARGGLLKPIPSGTYLVDEEMLDDLRKEKYQSHASNYGAILAMEIASLNQVEAYIVDPVVVDELQPIARISGLKGIERRSIAHVLNQKAVARKIMEKMGKRYQDSNVIVAHLGGGISIGAHQKGRMIDVINGLDGEGPYSPERTGSLPLYPFAQKVLKEPLTLAQVKKLTVGQGGIYSYLQETNIQEIEAGPAENRIYLDAMCYQIGKGIGEMAIVLQGNVDCIILTGGMAHSPYVIRQIQQWVNWLGPVEVFPGQMEMEALYEGVIRVLNGTEQGKSYQQSSSKEVSGRNGI